MTRTAIAYAATLVFFAGIDALYLGTIGARTFKATLGDVMAPQFQITPAILFYLLFPIGLMIFAVGPALASGQWSGALVSGALLGFFAYATYDLTNWATIRNWTPGLAAMDLVWGTVLSGVSATAAFFVAKATVGTG